MDDAGWEARMAERARLRRIELIRSEAVAKGEPLSPEQCWKAWPDACRRCYEPRPWPGWRHDHVEGDPRWQLWRVCELGSGCDCGCHALDGPAVGAVAVD